MRQIFADQTDVSSYTRLKSRWELKFCAVGAGGLAAQMLLQWYEVHHDLNIYYWSFLQGSILANVGMAINKWWTFKERNLSWIWALLVWNVQKVPHSAVSMAMFASLMQVPFLTYREATPLAAGIAGIGSLVATDWFIGKQSAYERAAQWLVNKLARFVEPASTSWRVLVETFKA